MASLKAIKRKAQAPGPYREALIALGHVQEKLQVLKVANGDTVLFRLGKHSQIDGQMIRAFMEIAAERGITDINCFLCGPEDTLQSIPLSAFAEIALMRGFVAATPPSCCESIPSGAIGPLSVEKEWIRKGGEKDGGSGLSTGNEEQPDSGAAEGKDREQGKTEGLRAEEQEGERFLSDEEVDELLNQPPFEERRQFPRFGGIADLSVEGGEHDGIRTVQAGGEAGL